MTYVISAQTFRTSSYLEHYGVKGMKWGVRRARKELDRHIESRRVQRHNEDSTLKKGKSLYRVATDTTDKTFADRKYFSTNKVDNQRWKNYFGKEITDRYGVKTYSQKYVTTKDLKIAGVKTQDKVYQKMLNNPVKRWLYIDNDRTSPDVASAWRKTYNNSGGDFAKEADIHIAANNMTGQMFIQELKAKGYGGLYDRHGANVSNDPVIIFNPDNTTVKKGKAWLNSFYI